MLARRTLGPQTTGDDVAGDVDLTDMSAIVTGGSSGIGRETARLLAARGATVTLTSRDLMAGELVAADIRESTGNTEVRAGELDLADMKSVNRFCKGWDSPLGILINNASVSGFTGLQHSADGWELHFAINVIGHCALTIGLFDHLAAGSEGARVVAVSSPAHLYCPVVFDDINFDFRLYDPVSAYGQSATAAILLAVAINTQWASAGIIANAVNPGAGTPPVGRADVDLRNPLAHHRADQQGAAAIIFAAASPLLDGRGGRYFDQFTEAAPVHRRTDELNGVAPYALDLDNAERLWAHVTRGRRAVTRR